MHLVLFPGRYGISSPPPFSQGHSPTAQAQALALVMNEGWLKLPLSGLTPGEEGVHILLPQ